MANALAIGFLIGRRHPARWPLVLGFAAAGLMAAASFVLATTHRTTYPWVDWYADLGVSWAAKVATGDRPAWFITLAYLSNMVMLGAPQLALACLGGVVAGRVARSRVRRLPRANPETTRRREVSAP